MSLFFTSAIFTPVFQHSARLLILYSVEKADTDVILRLLFRKSRLPA